MIYNLYQIWKVYNIILHIHGVYIAYTYLCWTLSATYSYFTLFLSYFYVSEPLKQIEDKKE